MDKRNPFYRYRNDKEFHRAYREESRRIELTLQLIEVRKRKRVTQAQLAKRAKMPQSQIARIESGEHNVTLDTLHRVLGALNATLKIA
jgi:predicted transcriptional regulator